MLRGAFACSLLLPLTSWSQDSTEQASSEYEQQALEEVTVTARKRVEDLQEVALSVSAMGQQEIEGNFATDLRDLIYISPNTVLDDTSQGPGGVAAAYIRGIGVSEVERNFDPAVGVVVDGIFRASASGSLGRALDLERVEVLRGPQGTLFGRNTIGGVIILEHSKPRNEFSGKLRAGYGNYDTSTLDGVVNIPLADTLALKLAGTIRDQNEGFFDNLNTGRDEGRVEYSSFTINPLWTPTENLEIEWTYVRERSDQDTPPLLNVGQPGQLFCDAFGWCSPNLSTPVSGDRYDVVTAYGNEATTIWPGPWNPPGYNSPHGFDEASFDADTNQLEVRWDINDAYRLDYIVGQWENEEKVVTDWDGVTDVLFHTDRPAEGEQLTNELRLTYDTGGKLAYTVGAYHWDSEYDIRLLSWIGFAVPGVILELPQFTHQDSKSKAVFFEGDWSFNDTWTLTLGGRYTEDEKTTHQTGIVNASAEAEWDEFTPKAALRYTIDDASMIYGLYSRGYRAGGFNGRVDSIETATIPYNPETVDNYELGYRSEWMDRRLVFNATAFFMDYKDKQEEIQQPSQTSGTGQVTRVVNAATASIKGAEFELTYLVQSGLMVRANLGYLDAGYDSFLVNTGTANAPIFADFSSLDFRRAPEWTGGLGLNYEWDLGAGSISAQAGYRYLGKHAVDFANKPEANNDAQHLVDASLTYNFDAWYVSGYVRNLLEEDGYQIGFDVAGLWTYAAPRPPRTYGIELGYRFGN
ncbi:MAG: TonB-dependent receptor [Lysobacterales bacterium]